MLDKTMSGAYPPGSTFKPFSALAALEDKIIDPRAKMQLQRAIYAFGRRIFRCTHVHGKVDLHEAIVAVVQRLLLPPRRGGRHGPHRRRSPWTSASGRRRASASTPKPRGRMPTHAWTTLHHKGQFRVGFTLNAAIGQGATTVTVLQLALAYAALANGGTLYQPQIVRAVETSDGSDRAGFPPRVRRTVTSRPENLALVDDALRGVVTEEGGTALQGAPQRRRHGRQDGHRADVARVARGRRARNAPGTSTATTRGSPASRRPRAPRSPSWSSSSTAARAAAPRRRSPCRWRATTRRLQSDAGLRAHASASRAPVRSVRGGEQASHDGLAEPTTLRIRERFDWPLFIGAALVAVIGIVNLYSATSVYSGARAELYISQVYWLVAGGIFAVFAASIDYRHFERLGYVLYTSASSAHPRLHPRPRHPRLGALDRARQLPVSAERVHEARSRSSRSPSSCTTIRGARGAR